MKKLIVSDLDGTIINLNLEKSFIIYLLRNDISFFHPLLTNICFHHILKFFHVLLKKGFEFKFYYYRIPFSKLNNHISVWLSQLRTCTNLRFNKKLLDNIDSQCKGIILTNCPTFISKPFFKEFLSEKFDFLVGTQIKLDSLKHRFHYKLRKKIFGKEKMKVLERIKNKSIFHTIGYGDSIHDLYFLELCDEYHLVTPKDFG